MALLNSTSKTEVALVLVGADDPGVERHVVGQQCVGDHALFQPEVLRGMAGVEGRNPSLELLPVAARVHRLIDVEVAEDRQTRGGVGNPIVGLLEGLQPDEVAGGGRELLVTQVGDVGHAPQSDVGRVGHQAGDDGRSGWHRLAVAPKHMLEGLHEAIALIDEQ